MSTISVAERFWQKVDKGGGWSDHMDSQCWDWSGSTTGAGYGNIFIGGSAHTSYAHRLSWEIANGPIPHGLQIAHLCGRSICVNPAHLIACGQSDNEGINAFTGGPTRRRGKVIRRPSLPTRM